MSRRTTADALALVNWKGVFYARYEEAQQSEHNRIHFAVSNVVRHNITQIN